MFALLTFVAIAAHAQTPGTPHQAQFEAIRKLSQNSELSCPTTAPKDGKVVVVFEGMKGFCPRVAAAGLPLWNDQYRLVDYAYDELKGQERVDFIKFVSDQHNFFHRCYLVVPVVEGVRDSKNVPAMLYYSIHGAPAATECLKSLQQKTEAEGKKLTISFLAYSLGGAAALRTIHNMHEAGANIDTVATIDPVAPNFRVLKATVGNGDSAFYKRPDYVKHWVNLYQHDDHTALTKGIFVPVGIRGSKVQGADLNLQLHPVSQQMSTQHDTILDTDEATQLILQMAGGELKNPQASKTPEGIEKEFSTPEN